MFCSCNLDFLRFTTDVRDSDCRVLGNVKGEITIYIGNSTDRRTLYNNVSPDNRKFVSFRDNRTGNFDVLRIYLYGYKRHKE